MGKLIRDKLLSKVKKTYPSSQFKKLDRKELKRELKVKLMEETKEFFQADSIEEETEELADILEVIETLTKLNYVDEEKLAKVKTEKCYEKGGFSDGIYWERGESE